MKNEIRTNYVLIATPYAFDKKTPNFAQGLDFLRFWSRFETLDIPRWLYIQFFMRNPNLRSKNAKF